MKPTSAHRFLEGAFTATTALCAICAQPACLHCKYHYPAALCLTCSNSAIPIHVQTRYQTTTRLSLVLGGPTAPMGRTELEAQYCPMTAGLVLTHSAYVYLLSCAWAGSDLSQCGRCISGRITGGLHLPSGRTLCPFADQDRVSQLLSTHHFISH